MIDVTHLRKSYGGTVALDGMTFTVLPGRVTGFAGPNGAGKSTTMRVILGLDRAGSQGPPWSRGRPYRALRHPLRHVGARCSTRGACSRDAPPATTCAGSPGPRTCNSAPFVRWSAMFLVIAPAFSRAAKPLRRHLAPVLTGNIH